MKKLILILVCFMCISSVSFSNNNQSLNTYNINVPLPDGIYFLCCESGYLNLYNMLGDLVGSGTDCGNLSGCYKVNLVTSSKFLKPNPTNPTGDYVLSMINSLSSAKGDAHSGSYGDMKEYYFLDSDVTW